MKKYRQSQKFKDWQKVYRKKRREDPEYVAKLKESKKQSFRRNYIHNLWKRTKDRAARKNLEFNLLESDIIIPEICPLLKIPLFIGTQNEYENSPTIDRIDNTKGYIKENCKIISMKANTMKNNATYDELKIFFDNIFDYMQNKDIV